MPPDSISQFQSPPILYVYSFFASAAVFAAVFRWLWLMRNDDIAGAKTLTQNIIFSQIYIFIALTVFSLLLTSYGYFAGDDLQGANIIPELIILMGCFYFFSRSYKRHEVPVLKGLVLELINTGFWVLSAIGVWCLALITGFLIFTVISFLSRNTMDILVFVIFLTGFAMIFYTLYFHRCMRKYDQAKTLRGFKSYELMWAALLAFGLFCMPLVLQEIINDPKWQAIKNEKPLRQL